MRIRIIGPAVIFELMALVRGLVKEELENGNILIAKTLKLIHHMITFLMDENQEDLSNLVSNCSTEFTWINSFSLNYMNEMGLKLFLAAISCADYAGDEEMAYEFAVQVIIFFL